MLACKVGIYFIAINIPSLQNHLVEFNLSKWRHALCYKGNIFSTMLACKVGIYFIAINIPSLQNHLVEFNLSKW
eukprot:c17408_g1_i2 orf=569-790(+)